MHGYNNTRSKTVEKEPEAIVDDRYQITLKTEAT